MSFQPSQPEQPSKDPTRWMGAASAVILAAGVGYAGYIIDKHNDEHPPTSNLEQIQENLGVNTDSAPAPQVPESHELPNAVVQGVTETNTVVEISG